MSGGSGHLYLNLFGCFSRVHGLHAAGETFPGRIRHHEALWAVNAGNPGPVESNRTFCIVDLDVEVALLELDDFAGYAVPIHELDHVFSCSCLGGSNCSRNEHCQPSGATNEFSTTTTEILHFPPRAFRKHGGDRMRRLCCLPHGDAHQPTWLERSSAASPNSWFLEHTTLRTSRAFAGPQASRSRALLLPVHVGEAKRLLTIVLDLQFVLLVELDLAEGCERPGPFAVLVDVEYQDAELVIARTRAIV